MTARALFPQGAQPFASWTKWSKSSAMNRRAFVFSLFLVGAVSSACTLRKEAAEPTRPGESERIAWLSIPQATIEKCGVLDGEARVVNTFFTFDAQQKVTHVRVEPGSPSHPELAPSPSACRCLEAELGQTRVVKGNFPEGVEMRQRLAFARPGQSSLPAFGRGEAAAGLGAVDTRACKAPNGPTGTGHVTVTFAPSGKVILAQVDGGPLLHRAIETCVTDAFEKVTIPPFSGQPVKVGKMFHLH